MNESMNISTKTFLSAIIILILLLLGAGILTQIIPQGAYDYTLEAGQSKIVPDSYHEITSDPLPIYKWIAAPIAVLFTSEGVIIITIILFLLIIGGSIGILNEAHILSSIIAEIIKHFSSKKYLLLRLIILIFMALGAFIGIFEEVIPLIPLILSLSYALGFNALTGLGMSLFATGIGFAAAVSNPFTIGVAQKIVDLPVFSGALYRLVIFALTYFILSTLIILYAKKIESKESEVIKYDKKGSKKAVHWFIVWMSVLILLILLSPFVSWISSYNLPIIGLVFLIAGFGSGLKSNYNLKETLKFFLKGAGSLLPGVILILLATGVKHIIQTGLIMDTILYYAANAVSKSSPFTAILLIYLLVFIMNFFIGSGSAKAFIIMPIVAPLLDMLGISRQLGVLAFQFGDGFSNVLYPTNAVLLIGIGIAGISYSKWFKWVIKYQILLGVLSVVALYIGLVIKF
ncbi:MAG: YfcC family protein [Clostridia bacterium]|nr:YfcC family protein [Clostridia bacterium]